MNETTTEILAGLRHTAEPDATAVKTPKFTPDEERDLERIDDHKAMGDLASTGLMAAGLLAGLKGGPKKLDGVRVFSGFDGMSGLQAGLKQNGVKVNEYLASEINPSAMKLTEHNFPQTKQLGDIQQINPATIGAVDIGAFGFPCQTLSSANHGGKIGLRDLTTGEPVMDYDTYVMGKKAGHKYSSSAMGLFEAIRIAKGLKEANPNVALMFENVASMRPENRQLIDGILSKELGLNPSFKMNTKGPTNRQRLMWTNIMGEDDYNALSDRMKQVEPNDVVEPNATHQLTKKGANSLQTDLFATEEPAPVPSKVTAKVGPRTGKLATATTNETPKLMQGDIEVEPNRRELANMAGLDKSFKVDAPITDKEFVHAVGNGWDLNQFKPLLTRFKNDVKGRMPKPEGRLGDENALKAVDETYLGDRARAHIGTKQYHAQGEPIEYYGNDEIGIPDMQRAANTSAVDFNEIIQDFERKLSYNPAVARDYDLFLRTSKITPRLLRYLEENDVSSGYQNFRPGIWVADSKRRLNSHYGPYHYRIDIPARELNRRAQSDMISVRPNFRDDNVINFFEPIPKKWTSPAHYPDDPLLEPGRFRTAIELNTDTKTAAQLNALARQFSRGDNLALSDVLPNIDVTRKINDAEKYPKALEYLDNQFLQNKTLDDAQTMHAINDPKYFKYNAPKSSAATEDYKYSPHYVNSHNRYLVRAHDPKFDDRLANNILSSPLSSTADLRQLRGKLLVTDYPKSVKALTDWARQLLPSDVTRVTVGHLQDKPELLDYLVIGGYVDPTVARALPYLDPNLSAVQQFNYVNNGIHAYFKAQDPDVTNKREELDTMYNSINSLLGTELTIDNTEPRMIPRLLRVVIKGPNWTTEAKRLIREPGTPQLRKAIKAVLSKLTGDELKEIQ
jgi:site-specific DNA-cytosine methylase